eukprot:1845499-Rhodomonas_salina.1
MSKPSAKSNAIRDDLSGVVRRFLTFPLISRRWQAEALALAEAEKNKLSGAGPKKGALNLNSTDSNTKPPRPPPAGHLRTRA